jgi:radical SAM superfamily enzyme YgiQ (UPF0313 family)
MRITFINPSNRHVNVARVGENRWNRYRIWQPLGLMVLAGLTPPDDEVAIVDENLGTPDYSELPRPDLVGITAFTSQANRAYELAAQFRNDGTTVVMGGIHATFRVEEVLERVDVVVTGEADAVWPQILDDVRAGVVKRRYDGHCPDLAGLPPARHDALPDAYAFGAIQTTRGCPLNCSFCSVTSFNGARYRPRPIADVVSELHLVREKRILVVDDNLIGIRPDHLARAKDLFRAMAQADLQKHWIAQVTINFADDDELLTLAASAGCKGVFIGFESPGEEGLRELGKLSNTKGEADLRASVRRIQKHGILVAGSFVMGLDSDEAGIGPRIAAAAKQYGVTNLNALFLTPLPGTRLWDRMEAERRLPLNRFPEDWQYYTLTLPVARYKRFSTDALIAEMQNCNSEFYSLPRILRRACGNLIGSRQPLLTLVSNLASRNNTRLARKLHAEFLSRQGARLAAGGPSRPDMCRAGASSVRK